MRDILKECAVAAVQGIGTLLLLATVAFPPTPILLLYGLWRLTH
jgi:hypothetical protein